MKALLLFILLLCQLTTVNGQQTGCRIPVTLLSLDFGLSSTQTAQSSQPIAQGEKDTVVSSPLSVDYHINQINLADSLYKNYLPQYNYDEVKAAVEFFEKLRTLESENLRNVDNSTSQVLKFSDSQVLNIPTSQVLKFSDSQFLYQCARAHYYHAVGLTERDDIVGACEHYLKALEIMDELGIRNEELGMKGRKSQGSQPIAQGTEEYEKTRFISLIYTRLGQIFYSNNYCDLAISKFRKALKLVELLDNSNSKSHIFKFLGNSYQLANKPDSALYFYNKSLDISSNLTNKLDVEKNIAHILFDKNEKDSAYFIIKNNLNKICNYGSANSYYAVLGEMYYRDLEYDSAIYYLEKSIQSQHHYTETMASMRLAAIYDSLGDLEKKSMYDNIYTEVTTKLINRSNEKAKLQNVYDKYKDRIAEKEKIRTKKKVDFIISLLIVFSIIIIILVAYVVYRHKTSRKKDVAVADEDTKYDILLKSDIVTMLKKRIDDMEYKTTLSKAHYSQYVISNQEMSLLMAEIESLSPGFYDSLKGSYDKLSKTNIKYCSLLLIDFDYKNIAIFLGVEASSSFEHIDRLAANFDIDRSNIASFLKDKFCNHS